MDIINNLGELNWLAIIAATFSAFVLGGVWYSNALFGECWMQEIGLTEESIDKSTMTRTYGTTFVLQLIAATTLATFIGTDGNWLSGLQSGAMIGLLWIAGAYGVTYLFEQRSIRLFLINAGYNVALFSIMGAVLGAWH